MRVARVHTNRTCNQNCAHCQTRRSEEDRELVAAAGLRIDRLPTALRELVLAGGEPALRGDLPTLVRRAKLRGPERIVLQTNAAVIDRERAHALADAGLDVARVHLPAWGAELDDITRDPGGARATEAGLAALADAGVHLEAYVPVVRANVDTVSRLPRRLVATGLPFRGVLLALPMDGPRAEALAPLELAMPALEATEAAARRQGLEVRLDPDTYVPPCLFTYPARVARLYALSRGGAEREGWDKVEQCAHCTVADRCPGLPRVAFTNGSAPRIEPIREDRIRRRLSAISSPREQIDRELQQEDVTRLPSGELIPQRIVRVNFRCNQACHFCFVSTHLPAAEDRAIREAIAGISRAGGIAVLSGGEPTLNPRLPEYVRLAKAEGARAVELQTNAIRCVDPHLVEELQQAGVDHAFVSLHGSMAETSDAVTNAPGTFEQTVKGLDELARSDIEIRLNFVFCELNREDFPAYVDMVAARWPSATLTVSFTAPSTDMVPRDRRLIPRYSDVLPALSEGLKRASAHGLRVTGFESMCGVPLCLVPSDISGFFGLAPVPEGFDGGEFVKPEHSCGRCALSDRCFGVRTGYAELHGTDELRPVTAPSSDRALSTARSTGQ